MTENVNNVAPYVKSVCNNIVWKIYILLGRDYKKFSEFICECILNIDHEQIDEHIKNMKNKPDQQLDDSSPFRLYLSVYSGLDKLISYITTKYEGTCLEWDTYKTEYKNTKTNYVTHYQNTIRLYYCLNSYKKLRDIIKQKILQSLLKEGGSFYFITMIFHLNFAIIIDIYLSIRQRDDDIKKIIGDDLNIQQLREKDEKDRLSLYDVDCKNNCEIITRIKNRKDVFDKLFMYQQESLADYTENFMIYNDIFSRLGIGYADKMKYDQKH